MDCSAMYCHYWAAPGKTSTRRANYHSCFASTILMGWHRQSRPHRAAPIMLLATTTFARSARCTTGPRRGPVVHLTITQSLKNVCRNPNPCSAMRTHWAAHPIMLRASTTLHPARSSRCTTGPKIHRLKLVPTDGALFKKISKIG